MASQILHMTTRVWVKHKAVILKESVGMTL